MGRFNWMWKAVQRPDPSWAGNKLKRITLIAASFLISPQATYAFDANTARPSPFLTDLSCEIHSEFIPDQNGGFASVFMLIPVAPFDAEFAGGIFWLGGTQAVGQPEISETTMRKCFADYTPNTLIQKGADAASFDAQELMGFGYLSSDSGQWYEYKLGSGTLQPIPKIDSATYNASTGELQVTGQNLKAAAGAMNDIKANKLSLTGEGGATYALTDTSDVEISSSTQFTITLSATDKGNLRELLNKNGSTSIGGTTYNLAAAEDWAVGAEASLTIADLSGNAVTVSNIVAPSAPTALVATPGDGKITVAFTAPTDTGGNAITDYEYQLNGGTWTTASTTSSPVIITGLTNGTSYSIKLRAVNSAGNGAESAAVSVLLGSPASAFEEAEEEIKAIITQDATRSLTSTLSSNQRMTRGARSRFIESRGQGEGDGAGLATRNNVPFDVDGTFDLAGARLSSKGTFFGQTGNVEGTERRLVFGEFDVQRDGDTGSTTATLTGRVAWEQMISDDTMLGYFVGGELADSNISGAFEGKQTRVAATAGGYAVRALSETLFADGFISIGAGRNNLEMADDVLALTSDYTTRTATVGGALTGVYAYERYELRPEMAFSYGKTWIGDVGFTGVAYGLTDNTLSVDAGTVSTASLTLRPEIVWALDAETVADSHAQLSFAPRFICERTTTATTTQNCGAGAEIGLSSNSEDGLSSANIRFVMDRVGNSNRSNVVFNVEQRF